METIQNNNICQYRRKQVSLFNLIKSDHYLYNHTLQILEFPDHVTLPSRSFVHSLYSCRMSDTLDIPPAPSTVLHRSCLVVLGQNMSVVALAVCDHDGTGRLPHGIDPVSVRSEDWRRLSELPS